MYLLALVRHVHCDKQPKKMHVSKQQTKKEVIGSTYQD